jgi:putative ABC transport system permease protein
VAELGFVALAPGLVGLLGRLAGRLPLSLRLAARDAARHRTRSGPAVGAITAAVAGSVAVSVYLASSTARERARYEPQYPRGTAVLRQYDDFGDPVPPGTVDAVAGRLPVRARADLGEAVEACREDAPCTGWSVEPPPGLRCASEDRACAEAAPRALSIAVGGPEAVPFLAGGPDDTAAAAFRAGRAVVTDARLLDRGEVVLVARTSSGGAAPGRERTLRLPAVAVRAPAYTGLPGVLVPPEAARRAGLPVRPTTTLLALRRLPTDAEEAAARGAAIGTSLDLYVERGFRGRYPFALLILLGASALVTVGATGIATGLAAADSRPDLATLAAVGAAPRVRRRLAMAQSATVAALGSLLGILAGLVPAIAVVAARAELPLAMPWASIAETAVAVPVGAALVVGAFTRARLPLERRLT